MVTTRGRGLRFVAGRSERSEVMFLSRHLTLRLTDEEIGLLDAGCRTLGLNRSAFLRFALREAAKGAEVEQRLASIERTLAEIIDLLHQGGATLASPRMGEGERDDGIREELAQSLRGILDDGI